MISYRRSALLAAIAAIAANNASVNAFSPSSLLRPFIARLLHESVKTLEAPPTTEIATETDFEPTDQLIMDIPPSPAAASQLTQSKPTLENSPAKPLKKAGNPHKEGIFSPIVVAAGTILGEEQLNKVRAKVISIHSDLIKSFVDTSDSAFGKAVLRQLFNFVDADDSGYLCKKEVTTALGLLGFRWLEQKHIDKIFERADRDGNEEISLEEFMEEAPKTLKANLIKLAKTNGGDMGLLV